ncbi:hypothetical protein P152DRAFT_211193 [Eremomyces bilateralis CBS 781.70]|uniref:Uncharacterized protein n=1 Tax=Eremomyces bilateralis CBS 781.70 TaxID=1392243 RepID=A0A6G1FSD4_9PEZI|nr:uncharacterized protein P152DRAFT_211193 [Eremomyces bilateralis CBS 781.70]KAF1808694.1 hypothetical protein P152DRAFT_211193 [Eremomyces bilateralis CBS 781.70]
MSSGVNRSAPSVNPLNGPNPRPPRAPTMQSAGLPGGGQPENLKVKYVPPITPAEKAQFAKYLKSQRIFPKQLKITDSKKIYAKQLYLGPSAFPAQDSSGRSVQMYAVFIFSNGFHGAMAAGTVPPGGMDNFHYGLLSTFPCSLHPGQNHSHLANVPLSLIMSGNPPPRHIYLFNTQAISQVNVAGPGFAYQQPHLFRIMNNPMQPNNHNAPPGAGTLALTGGQMQLNLHANVLNGNQQVINPTMNQLPNIANPPHLLQPQPGPFAALLNQNAPNPLQQAATIVQNQAGGAVQQHVGTAMQQQGGGHAPQNPGQPTHGHVGQAAAHHQGHPAYHAGTNTTHQQGTTVPHNSEHPTHSNTQQSGSIASAQRGRGSGVASSSRGRGGGVASSSRGRGGRVASSRRRPRPSNAAGGPPRPTQSNRASNAMAAPHSNVASCASSSTRFKAINQSTNSQYDAESDSPLSSVPDTDEDMADNGEGSAYPGSKFTPINKPVVEHAPLGGGGPIDPDRMEVDESVSSEYDPESDQDDYPDCIIQRRVRDEYGNKVVVIKRGSTNHLESASDTDDHPLSSIYAAKRKAAEAKTPASRRTIRAPSSELSPTESSDGESMISAGPRMTEGGATMASLRDEFELKHGDQVTGPGFRAITGNGPTATGQRDKAMSAKRGGKKPVVSWRDEVEEELDTAFSMFSMSKTERQKTVDSGKGGEAEPPTPMVSRSFRDRKAGRARSKRV